MYASTTECLYLFEDWAFITAKYFCMMYDTMQNAKENYILRLKHKLELSN